MFGCDLERRLGQQFFLRYYFITVIGGGILNTLFVPNQMGPSIGASAGVYGILLAYGLIYPNRIVYFYFLFPIKMKHFVWIIGAIALYSSITAGQSGIAHLAHLGGMVFGYIYLRGCNPWERFKDYRDRRRLTRLKRRFQIHTGGKDDAGPTVSLKEARLRFARAPSQPASLGVSHEIRNTPKITSSTAPIFRGVSCSTSFRKSAESGNTNSEEPLINGEMIDTRSMLSAV